MKVVFLDRDGVINKKIENGYVLRWEEFEFLPDVAAAIKSLNERGIPVYLVSNQSAVNRGYITVGQLNAINDRMLKEFAKKGVRIDDLFICPHRPDENCDCRKPKTGLLKQAAEKYNIDFKDSWFVGDSETDVEAGQKMGCKTHLLGKDENLKAVIEKIINN